MFPNGTIERVRHSRSLTNNFQELEDRRLLAVLSFQDGVLPTASYLGTSDTEINGSSRNRNYGSSTTLTADNNEAALLKWDLSSIPAGSTIQAVQLTLNVTNGTSQAYELYELERNWVEAQATWNNFATGQAWQTSGARGTLDRSTTVLGTITGPTGLRTFQLNASGVAAVQSWINDPASNFGFILQDYGNSNNLRFTSSETGTLANRPRLEVTFLPPSTNQPPAVSAGPDQTLNVPDDTATLDGTATDDGLPSSGTLSVAWTQVSGPGTVNFADVSAEDTTASFSEAGTYVLRLTANDGALVSSDDIRIEVNESPIVSAGPDQTITLPDDATLNGTVTDDGLPSSGTLSVAWTEISGPGAVNFANASAVDTAASFSEAGTYVLRLTANDGAQSAFDEITVSVEPANQPPTVDAGPDQTINVPDDTATLDGTATDDGLPSSGTLSVAWTQVSGPGTASFADASVEDTTASFSEPGAYVLRLTANDGALQTSDDIRIEVNESPIVDAGPDQTITLPNNVTLNGTVSDDGLPSSSALTITWSAVSGPGTVTFTDTSAEDTTASFSEPGTYVLRLTADDGARITSDDISVEVQPTSNLAPIVDAGPDQTIILLESAILSGSFTDDGLPAPPSTVTTAWTKVDGPGTVVFANASAANTSAVFGALGDYVLRLTADDGDLTAFDEVVVHVEDPQVTASKGIWISREEILALPISGPAWETLASASEIVAAAPNIADQNDDTDVYTLAKAMVGVRTGDLNLIEEARTLVMAAINTEDGGRTLALARNLASYVIAADIVGLNAAQDATFSSWLQGVLGETMSDNRTLRMIHEMRPNNWGSMAGASRAAAALYLDDQAELERTALVFRGYLGDRSAYAGFVYGDDLSWQADPTQPVPINPVGAIKEGHSIDGAMPDEMRRGGSFQWPPVYTMYGWGGLQGAYTQAELLYRAGYDVYQWSDQALRRAVDFLYSLGATWEPTGDDGWLPWLVNARYGTNYAAAPTAAPGKIMGWTAWTCQ